MKPALATFFGALGFAGLSILVGLARLVAIWQNGSRGISSILLILIDAVLLAYPDYLAMQYRKLPPIHDIARPDRSPALRGAGAAAHRQRHQPRRLCRLYSAEQQRLAYPDIETVELGVPRSGSRDHAAPRHQAEMARHRRARPAAATRHWCIEAVARTPIMGSARTCRSASRPTATVTRRYPLGVALFRERSRQQRRAHLQADRRHQHSRRQRQPQTGEEAGGAGQSPPKVVKK